MSTHEVGPIWPGGVMLWGTSETRELRELWRGGLRLRAIAARFNCSTRQVEYEAKRLGLIPLVNPVHGGPDEPTLAEAHFIALVTGQPWPMERTVVPEAQK